VFKPRSLAIATTFNGPMNLTLTKSDLPIFKDLTSAIEQFSTLLLECNLVTTQGTTIVSGIAKQITPTDYSCDVDLASQSKIHDY
jgi:hypothetical protein